MFLLVCCLPPTNPFSAIICLEWPSLHIRPFRTLLIVGVCCSRALFLMTVNEVIVRVSTHKWTIDTIDSFRSLIDQCRAAATTISELQRYPSYGSAVKGWKCWDENSSIRKEIQSKLVQMDQMLKTAITWFEKNVEDECPFVTNSYK